LLAPQRGLIATDQNQNRIIMRHDFIHRTPQRLGETALPGMSNFYCHPGRAGGTPKLIRIQRSVVEGEVNATKTEASQGILPLDPDLAENLLSRRGRSSFNADSDFVFVGRSGKPPWPDGILTDHLKPTAARAEIGNIGWHSFRHTYSTMLHGLGAKPVVQKERLRHSDIRTTLNIYTHAISAEKREAASKVVGLLWKA
jgi:integrase